MPHPKQIAEKAEIALHDLNALELIVAERMRIVDGYHVHLPAELLICLHPRVDERHVVFLARGRIAGRRHEHIAAEVILQKGLQLELRGIFRPRDLSLTACGDQNCQNIILEPRKGVHKGRVQIARAERRAMTVHYLQAGTGTVQNLAVKPQNDLLFRPAFEYAGIDQKRMRRGIVLNEHASLFIFDVEFTELDPLFLQQIPVFV